MCEMFNKIYKVLVFVVRKKVISLGSVVHVQSKPPRFLLLMLSLVPAPVCSSTRNMGFHWLGK
jgi:hypothetical protein